MDNTFFLKTIISFITAGIWIGGATLIAERLGSKKGGLVSNLPSTILIALVFVALVQDTRFAAAATDAVPIGMLIDTLFLLVFILLVKHGLIKTVLLSLATWFVLAFAARHVHSSNIILNIILYTAVAVGTYLLLEYKTDIPAKGKNRKKYTPGSLLIRALFAGSVVAGTIILSTFAGTYWVGLFSTFPAVMLSTMVILTVNQGADFARAVGKIMILSSTNIIVYSVGVSLTYPSLGIALGTILSFGLAFLWILLLHPVIQKLSR
jgi:signal transduction histidine kinase